MYNGQPQYILLELPDLNIFFRPGHRKRLNSITNCSWKVLTKVWEECYLPKLRPSTG